MSRFTFILLILFALMASSCTSRKNKLDRRNLIPEDKLISILTESYIADGLLTMPKIRVLYSRLDSLATYDHIIEKYGYTQALMDKTIKYYYIKKPKDLIKIYDKVLSKLSVLESLNEKETALSKEHPVNLWPGHEYYSFPDTFDPDSTAFHILLGRPGIYTFTVNATLFPDDQTVNPRITLFYCNADSLETGKRNYINSLRYIKDGQPHSYTFLLRVPFKTRYLLKGWLYDIDNQPDDWGRHIILRNISLTFTLVSA